MEPPVGPPASPSLTKRAKELLPRNSEDGAGGQRPGLRPAGSPRGGAQAPRPSQQQAQRPRPSSHTASLKSAGPAPANPRHAALAPPNSTGKSTGVRVCIRAGCGTVSRGRTTYPIKRGALAPPTQLRGKPHRRTHTGQRTPGSESRGRRRRLTTHAPGPPPASSPRPRADLGGPRFPPSPRGGTRRTWETPSTKTPSRAASAFLGPKDEGSPQVRSAH